MNDEASPEVDLRRITTTELAALFAAGGLVRRTSGFALKRQTRGSHDHRGFCGGRGSAGKAHGQQKALTVATKTNENAILVSDGTVVSG